MQEICVVMNGYDDDGYAVADKDYPHADTMQVYLHEWRIGGEPSNDAHHDGSIQAEHRG